MRFTNGGVPASLALALTLLLAAPVGAADTAFMVETDPATFIFRGFAAHVRVVPGRGHVAIGAGAYALDFPGLLVDLNPNDRGAGWNVRMRIGVGAFGDYYFRPDAEGWFVGTQIALQNYRYTNDNVPGQVATATNVLVMPRGGYQWRPFDAGFYVMPWIGLGVSTQVAGDRRVGDRRYELSRFVPYGALHVGWKF